MSNMNSNVNPGGLFFLRHRCKEPHKVLVRNCSSRCWLSSADWTTDPIRSLINFSACCRYLKVGLCSDTSVDETVWFWFLELNGMFSLAVLKLKHLTLNSLRFISIVCLPLAPCKLSAMFTGLSDLPWRRRESHRVPYLNPQPYLLP